MTYEELRACAEALDAECARLGAILQGYPRGALGMTSDAAKATPEWRADRAAFDVAFARLRHVNGILTKHFKSELRADRDERRRLKLENRP